MGLVNVSPDLVDLSLHQRVRVLQVPDWLHLRFAECLVWTNVRIVPFVVATEAGHVLRVVNRCVLKEHL